MAFEHVSGIANAHDRAADRPDMQGVVFSADRIIQSAELNELQTIARGRASRVSDLVARDGDRVAGAAAVVQPDLGNVILTAGRIYLRGDVFEVGQAVLSGVPMVGTVEIGVAVSTTYVTHETDPTLLGIAAGALSEGEPGAAREVVSIAWSLAANAPAGEFVPIYTLVDGVILDQTPPPALSGINQQIAVYDRDAHGNYIVRGCKVAALGKIGSDQVFAIAEGTANIRGMKRTREAALRHAEPEAYDVAEVAGETHTFEGSAANVFELNRSPIAAVSLVLVTKQTTANIVRGAVSGTADTLPNSSVTSILSIVQGGTTYLENTDWTRVGDTIDWSPAGAEPAPGSTYAVTYRYLETVTPDAVTDETVTVSGGVDGTTVVIGYTWKLPRIDLLCLDQAGASVYVKGISAAADPLPPIAPDYLLPLAEIRNTWAGTPAVTNNGVRSIPYAEQWRLFERLKAHERLIQLERLKSGIDAREPTAKLGTFVDPFTGDELRDAGVSQTGAVGRGKLELAIAPTFYLATLAGPVMLDYVEDVIIRQERATGSLKINPYQNFTPLPGALRLDPPADFWTEQETAWASPATVEFNRGVRVDNGPLVVETVDEVLVGSTSDAVEFLRQIPVSFEILGFGGGEILDDLLFDGVSVKPAGTVTADVNGRIAGTFVIPAGITAGTKWIGALGQGGTKASAMWTGAGVIETTILRRVTTVERWTPQPPPPPPPTPNEPEPGPDPTPPKSDPRWPYQSDGGDSPSANPSESRGQSSCSYDPLAQTFTLAEARQLIGVDVKIAAIGEPTNAILVHQVAAETGLPTTAVEAEAFVPMTDKVVGAWVAARYPLPVLTGWERERAIVVKTDDAAHSLAVAALGGFDAESQSWVGAQPYAVGVLLSSSNARTWTPHQGEDLAFRIVAARYTATTKTVGLGSFNLVDASELQVRAAVELPSAACSVVFEIVRPNGQVWRLRPHQVLRLTEYVTETVQLRAVLTGTEKLSPVLFAPVVLIAGKLAASGTYVSRAFKLGTNVRLAAYLKAKLPAGSSVSVEYDKGDGNWLSLPLGASEVLSDPAWIEQKREASGISATQGRLKITIAGTPAARPEIGDLGAAVM